MKSKIIARNSLMVSLCLILTYVEVLIPLNFAIPGAKIGLSSIVVVFALYNSGIKSAFGINIVRILLAGFLFANPIMITYSIAGGLLSFIMMVLIKKLKIFSLISVSITGGIFHNIGQIIAAYFYLGSDKVIYYLPFLLIFGLIAGLLTGIIGSIVVERTSNI